MEERIASPPRYNLYYIFLEDKRNHSPPKNVRDEIYKKILQKVTVNKPSAI